MLKAIVEDFGNGGTIDGDLVVSGDLTVSGGGSLSFDEIIEGTQVIDVNSTEALLVRKNGDGGDVFKVDSTNATIYIQDGIGTLPSLFGGHQLVLQNNNDSGDQSRLALISGATGYSVLDFGDASDVDAGGIAYQNHASDDLMTLRVNATDFVYIKDSGVGIGGSPSSLLHLQGNNGNASHTLLKIHNNDVTSNTETGQTADIEFSFQGTTDGGSNFVTKNAGAIRAGKESDYFTSSADNMDSFLAFYTSQDNTNTLAMHIDASQNVGINEVSPDKKLHITSSTSTDGIMVEQSGVGSALISFKADNANRGFIGVDDSNGGAILSSTSGSDYIMCLRSEQEMHFGTNGNNVALQLDTSQNATFAGSVTSGNKYVIDGNTASNQKFQFHDDNVGLQRAGGSDRTANGNSLYVSAYEDIVFTASAAAMGSQSERMRIDGDGGVTFSQPVDGDAYITVDNVTGGSSSVNETAALRLQLGDGSTLRGGAKITAKKEADYSTGANMDASLMFSVLQNNAYNNALFLTSAGNLGVGVSEPGEKLAVADGNIEAIMTTAGAGLRIIVDRVDTSDYAGFEARTGGNQKWFIGLRETGDENLHF